MSLVTVTLDDFVFQDMEVPDAINFGGAQMVRIHRLVGGKRVIDAMGADDDPLEWGGRFRGADAVERARTLDAKRQAGKAVPLSWGEMAFTVVIVHFKAIYENPYEIPYLIRLEVVEERSLATEPGMDEMCFDDQASCDDLTGQLDDATLSGQMGALDGVMAGAGSFASANLATLQGVLNPLANVQARVADMIAGAETQVVSMLPLGPTKANSAAVLAGVVLSQVDGLSRVYRLYDLDNFAGRLESNLQSQAGLKQGPPAISGEFRPPEPDYAAALAFNARLSVGGPIAGVSSNQGGSVPTTFSFPDWPSEFLASLDFAIQ